MNTVAIELINTGFVFALDVQVKKNFQNYYSQDYGSMPARLPHLSSINWFTGSKTVNFQLQATDSKVNKSISSLKTPQ
jgi:hypothetical protein